ncbi:Ger(x)C family spore germination protein [Peribacillus frigoritolerans]|uniref:Ger(x)C family spore germination protein n=1 Tax=Peribacillus frigoritolerans TaxID=450367 RepID=UPI00222744C2|nr:Ger(x)C family spore germination protein [Peribacillus frigoritolerans]UYY96940.1 Ger(x)C family spore germination protein [Peribacillus frigoritolerans]
MKMLRNLLTILGCLILTVGCWDQHLMKDATLIQATSYDLTREGKLLLGTSIPIIGQASSESGQAVTRSEVLFTIANTPREGNIKIDQKVPGTLDPSKNILLVFGEPFARKGIYPSLDAIYRQSRNSLSAKLAVVEGNAIEILRLQPEDEPNISQHLLSLLQSAEENSNIPEENIQTLASEMLDPGEDIVLPYLKVNKNEKTAEIAGLALLNEEKFSGSHLSIQESILFLLLEEKKGKYAQFTKRVSKNQKPDMNNFITINVKNMKRKLKVSVNRNGDVVVNLNLRLKVFVTEYPKGDVDKEIDKLNKKLSRSFSKDATQVISKLQKANCDALGIGRHLIAFYPNTWKEKDKKEYLRNVKFKTTVDVEIVQVGIAE